MQATFNNNDLQERDHRDSPTELLAEPARHSPKRGDTGGCRSHLSFRTLRAISPPLTISKLHEPFPDGMPRKVKLTMATVAERMGDLHDLRIRGCLS